MDIRDFYKSTQENKEKSTHTNETNQTNFDEYTEAINKYKNLSQQDLYDELLSQASNLKAEGKLDSTSLEKLSSTLAPMLNDEQQQLLSNIIERLK